MDTLDFIYNKWKSKVITGEEQAEKPKLCNFNNIIPAVEMLHNYMTKGSNIVIHCDVDMDGIGSGYIPKRFFGSMCNSQMLCVINKEKVHGISQRQVDFFNGQPFDMVLIVDSSSNEIENIKKIHHDVLVVDHHEILHNEVIGKTEDGHDFIIVNNMLENLDCETTSCWLKKLNSESKETIEPFKSTPDMSCGLVIYELLRVYQEAYRLGPMLENLMLYQWAGVTLFTDVIKLTNARNQWYVTNTCFSQYTEPTLDMLMRSISSWNTKLSKTVINFSIAPMINKAIRGSASGRAMQIVMAEPTKAKELEVYKDRQTEAIEKATKLARVYDSYVLCDITNSGISKNYTGVIAGKLCDENDKNTIAYTVDSDGYLQGSFRGRLSDTDYRVIFDTYSEDSSGQGHKGAFGFKAKMTDIHNIMMKLVESEKNYSSKEYVTAGDMPEEDKGVYHIDDFNAFKMAGGIMKLAIGNSRVSSDEQIMVCIPASMATLTKQMGKLYCYDVSGVECKAFKEINTKYIHLYPEFNKSIEVYIK